MHIEAPSATIVHLRAVSLDAVQWYAVPTEEKPLGEHKHLMTIPKVKQAASDCTKITTTPERWPKYRRIKLPISDDLKKLYFDPEGDLVVNGHYLEEINEEFRHDRLPKASKQSAQPSDEHTGQQNTDLKALLERLVDNKIEVKKERELVKLRDLKNLFLINEYNGKANASQWMNQFIKECERLEISEAMRSEALRMFVGKNLNDWFLANAMKLQQDDWRGWKQSFTETYAKRGWSEIKDALLYQHYSGSLVDYANTKERKILEADREMPEKYRVIQIVIGLPAAVREEIDREKTTTFAELVAKLREQEDSVSWKKRTGRDRKQDDSKNWNREKKPDDSVASKLFVKKKPCEFCEMIGFKNNYHRLEDCKNKAKYAAAVKQSKSNDTGSSRSNREVHLNELVTAGLDDLNGGQKSGRRRDSSSSSSDSSSSSNQSGQSKNE